MKTALEEAQANLTVAQSWAKSQMGSSGPNETFKVGNEVVLSTPNILCEPAFAIQIMEALV